MYPPSGIVVVGVKVTVSLASALLFKRSRGSIVILAAVTDVCASTCGRSTTTDPAKIEKASCKIEKNGFIATSTFLTTNTLSVVRLTSAFVLHLHSFSARRDGSGCKVRNTSHPAARCIDACNRIGAACHQQLNCRLERGKVTRVIRHSIPHPSETDCYY